MTPDEHKALILAHCLRFAQIDPEAAIHAAGWYEANQPWLLKNLRRKVEQAVHCAEHRTSVAAVDEPLLAQRAGARGAGEC